MARKREYCKVVAMDYDTVFAKVIAKRWNALPVEEQRKASTKLNRQGRLAPDDPDSFALWDTREYQRGHIDVFKEVYKQANHCPPKKYERLMVVDIGAGAATVAVALHEALSRTKCKRIDYLAFDPHPMMQKLGKQVLKHLDAGFRTATYIESLEDVGFTRAARVLFTFSYVAHQETVKPTDINEWASLIERAVCDTDRAVELMYTTTAKRNRRGAHLDLYSKLRSAKIIRKCHPVSVEVQRRFPNSVDSKRKETWRESTEHWQVEAGHWILSK